MAKQAANKKVKNARKVDIDGQAIVDVKQWKKENPDQLYFDSKLEWKCYKALEASTIEFTYKPDSITLIPKQESLDWEYTPEQLKNLRDMQKGVKNKTEKSANTRWFNSQNKKQLTKVKMPAWTWSADFYLPGLEVYIDTKGNKKDMAWRNKLKSARHLLRKDDVEVIQLQTQKEITEFINYLMSYEK